MAGPSPRLACDLLLLSLVLPPLFLHALGFVMVEVLPLGDPVFLRQVLGWAMPAAFLFVATPLSLLAYPGAARLVKALPEPPALALFMRVLALLFSALTVGATAARFSATMPVASALQEAASLAKLAVGLGVCVALLTGKASAHRALLLGAIGAAAVALLFQGGAVLVGGLSPRLMVGVRGASAALMAAALLQARRAT